MNSWLFIRWIIPSEYISHHLHHGGSFRRRDHSLRCCHSADGYHCIFPLCSYQHGTITERYEVPSFEGGELFLGIVFAPGGYVVCMPDYLGLGLGEGLHPYCHAKSEATATVDMLRATRQVCDEQDIHLNDQTFLFGYSQGGHATMAAALNWSYTTQMNSP